MLNNFRVLDLFSGAGGFSLGISMNKNFNIVVANDFNKNALHTFKKNKPKTICIYGDIKDPKTKLEIIEISKRKKVNMIIGGPPCQGFSLKGKKLGLDDPRNFLFNEFIEIVAAIKPEIFVIENVKNMISACDGFFLNEIKEKMKKLGYHISFKILNAKNFMVPQNRERAIIIGSLTKKINLPIGSSDVISVKDAISDLAYLSSGEGCFESAYLNNPESKYQKMMRHKNGKLYNHVATKHSNIALKKLMFIPPECGKEFLPKKYLGKQKFNTTWCRLSWNEVSPTIDTRFDTPSNGKNSHPFLHRSITPREAARLQSFPDSFVFYGSKTEICKQIGNAVPPLLGKSLADEIEYQYKNYIVG